MSIKADVDRGLEIRAEQEKLDKELKEIHARLTKVALAGEQVPLADADREGRQYLAHGSTQVVPVIITADMLVGEFGRDTARHKEIIDAVQNQTGLLKFFKPVNKFENRFDNGKKFRGLAAEVFGGLAPAFITACVARDKDGIAKTAIKVMWDDAAKN